MLTFGIPSVTGLLLQRDTQRHKPAYLSTSVDVVLRQTDALMSGGTLADCFWLCSSS